MKRPKTVPMNEWGSDHWSTLAYIETRIVDYGGIPDKKHMRCHNRIHPHFAHIQQDEYSGSLVIPTRLANGKQLHLHDDWCCLWDAVDAGLIECKGTGLNPVFSLTKDGYKIAAALRSHRANGQNYSTFRANF